MGVDLPARRCRRRRRTAPGASPSSTGTAGGTGRRSVRASSTSDGGQPVPCRGVEVGQAGGRPPRDRERLERPGRPERHDDQPLVALDDDARPARFLGRRSRAAGAGRSPRGGAAWLAASRCAPRPAARCPAQIWPCGWGFEAPIAAPRFSKTWTQRKSAPELARLLGPDVDDPPDRRQRHRRRGSGRGAARSRRPGRHHVRLRPGGGRRSTVASDVSVRSAAKSLSKTNVVP